MRAPIETLIHTFRQRNVAIVNVVNFLLQSLVALTLLLQIRVLRCFSRLSGALCVELCVGCCILLIAACVSLTGTSRALAYMYTLDVEN